MWPFGLECEHFCLSWCCYFKAGFKVFPSSPTSCRPLWSRFLNVFSLEKKKQFLAYSPKAKLLLMVKWMVSLESECQCESLNDDRSEAWLVFFFFMQPASPSRDRTGGSYIQTWQLTEKCSPLTELPNVSSHHGLTDGHACAQTCLSIFPELVRLPLAVKHSGCKGLWSMASVSLALAPTASYCCRLHKYAGKLANTFSLHCSDPAFIAQAFSLYSEPNVSLTDCSFPHMGCLRVSERGLAAHKGKNTLIFFSISNSSCQQCCKHFCVN